MNDFGDYSGKVDKYMSVKIVKVTLYIILLFLFRFPVSSQIIDGMGFETFKDLKKLNFEIKNVYIDNHKFSYEISLEPGKGEKMVKLPLLPAEGKIKKISVEIEGNGISCEHDPEERVVYLTYNFPSLPVIFKIEAIPEETFKIGEVGLPQVFYRLEKSPALPSWLVPDLGLEFETFLAPVKVIFTYNIKHGQGGKVIFKEAKKEMKSQGDLFNLRLSDLAPGDFVSYKVQLSYENTSYSNFLIGNIPVLRDPWEETYGVGWLGGCGYGGAGASSEEFWERVIEPLHIKHLISIAPRGERNPFLEMIEERGKGNVTVSLFPCPDSHWWGVVGNSRKWLEEHPETWKITAEGERQYGGGGYQLYEDNNPIPSFLHPTVRKHIGDQFLPFIERYKDYQCLFGLVSDGEWGFSWSMIDWGRAHEGKQCYDYAPWFIEWFQEETGIKVAGKEPKDWAKWIKENCWGKFEDWCRRQQSLAFYKAIILPARKFRPELFGGCQPNADYWSGLRHFRPWHEYRITLSDNYPVWPRIRWSGQDINERRRSERGNFAHYYGHYVKDFPMLETGLTPGSADAGPAAPEEYKEWFLMTLVWNPHYIPLWAIPENIFGEVIRATIRKEKPPYGSWLETDIARKNWEYNIHMLMDKEEMSFTRRMADKLDKLPYIWNGLTLPPWSRENPDEIKREIPGFKLITQSDLVYLLVTKDPGSMYYVWIINVSSEPQAAELHVEQEKITTKGEIAKIDKAKRVKSLKEEEDKNWFEAAFKESGWEEVNLPHPLSPCKEEYFLIGFDLPELYANCEVYLLWKEMGCRTWVWFNSQELGEIITGKDNLFELKEVKVKDNLLAIKAESYLKGQLNPVKVYFVPRSHKYAIIDAIEERWLGIFESSHTLPITLEGSDFVVYRIGVPLEALSMPTYFRDIGMWKGDLALYWDDGGIKARLSAERPLYLRHYYSKGRPEIEINGQKPRFEKIGSDSLIFRLDAGENVVKIFDKKGG